MDEKTIEYLKDNGLWQMIEYDAQYMIKEHQNLVNNYIEQHGMSPLEAKEQACFDINGIFYEYSLSTIDPEEDMSLEFYSETPYIKKLQEDNKQQWQFLKELRQIVENQLRAFQEDIQNQKQNNLELIRILEKIVKTEEITDLQLVH